MITVDWFMCLFATSLPASTVLRLWDALFLVGSEAIFRLALVLFDQVSACISVLV